MNLPLIDERVRDLAVHGSYCPKLCSHTCPVLAATGRDEAVPWSLHRVVADLATGRAEPEPGVDAALHHCTGCGACATACGWEDQDVPAQVRSGRAATFTVASESARTMVENVAAGRTPGGAELLEVDQDGLDATATVVVGCRDRRATVDAFVRLCDAAEVSLRVVVPAGCCGSILDDIGAVREATTARTSLEKRLRDGMTTVALDPHCLPSLRSTVGGDVTDAVTYISGLVTSGRLSLPARERAEVTWHDPCVLARTEGVVDTPRHLLGAVGIDVAEVEDHGTRTRCSGAGMGYPDLEPADAARVAVARAAQLDRSAKPVVTACPRARDHLSEAGTPIHDLFEFLADHLEASP